MESSSPRPRRAKKTSHLPHVDQEKAPPGAPKVVTRSLVDLVQEAGLDGVELSEFVEEQQKNLQQLQILHVKKNVTGLSLDTNELNALLSVLDVHAEKASFAVAILKAASETLPPTAVQQFAMKLARMGIHQ